MGPNESANKLRGVGTLAALLAVGAAALALFGGGCSKADDPWADVPGGPPYVLTSFPPLYCFAKNVAGDDAAVLCLLTTVGPHDHKPGSQDALAVQKASLFFTNGLGLDETLTRVVNTAGSSKLRFVKLGEQGVPKSKRIQMGEVVHGDHVHPAGDDPHVWLGIDEAIGMVKVIRNHLKEIDPKHADGYEERAAAYVAKLEKLHADGKKLLDGKQKPRSLLTNHDSLSYFARSFDLQVVQFIQNQPGIEADGVRMAALVEACKKHQVRVITVEPQYKRSNAEALRAHLKKNHDIDVAVVEIDPLETAERGELDAGLYERVMRANLETLAKHLP